MKLSALVYCLEINVYLSSTTQTNYCHNLQYVQTIFRTNVRTKFDSRKLKYSEYSIVNVINQIKSSRAFISES